MLALAEHDDLDVPDLEASTPEPVDEVGRLVVGIRLPLEGLAPLREEGDLSVDRGVDVLRGLPETLGRLHHRSLPARVPGVGAADESDPLGEVEGSGVTLGQAHLAAELGEQLGGRHASIPSRSAGPVDRLSGVLAGVP